MSLVDITGWVAFITTVIGLFPQIFKAIKTRSTSDISMSMLINFMICSIAWIMYGFYSNSMYVQLSNILELLSCIVLIVIKIHYDRNPEPLLS